MFHDYYYYNREQLLAAPKIPLIVMEDNETVFRAMADEMADEIQRKNALGEKTVLICPVGPVGQYPYFVDRVNRGKYQLEKCMVHQYGRILDRRQAVDRRRSTD